MIVHVITNLHASSGGPTTAVVELAREQAAAGEPVRVVVDESLHDGVANTAAPDRWTGLDARIAASAGDVRGSRLGRGRLVQVLRALGPRIVHLHGVWDPILRRSCAACSELGIPWVLSSHGMLHPFALRRGVLRKFAYLSIFGRLVRGARTVLTLNAEEADAVRRRFRVPAIVAPTGIDAASFDRVPDGSFARSVPGLDGQPFVLFLGRLDPIKGVDLLVDSYARAVASGLKVHLVVAGPDQGSEPDLRAQVDRLGIRSQVHFVGALSGIRKLQALAECAVFAHRPRYEGFGLAVVEAMAAGRPVLTTASCRLDGAAMGRAVRLAEDRTDSFASSLADLVDDPSEAAALGDRARAWVRSELAWPAVLARVERGYRS